MAANWSALRDYLTTQGDRVDLSWRELEDIVGGMPASSIDHQAWWSGDRPQTRAWQAAGYRVAERTPGVRVVFERVGGTGRPAAGVVAVERPAPPPSQPVGDAGRVTDVVLVSCVKEKLPEPAPARELYRSALFTKMRAHAEASGRPWFILSAEHGLVAPDEWLAPYDRYLGDTPADYRRVWGEWIVARLELLVGTLSGTRVEVHAGASYVDPLREPLRRRGAVVDLPLAGSRSESVFVGTATAGRSGCQDPSRWTMCRSSRRSSPASSPTIERH